MTPEQNLQSHTTVLGKYREIRKCQISRNEHPLDKTMQKHCILTPAVIAGLEYHIPVV